MSEAFTLRRATSLAVPASLAAMVTPLLGLVDTSVLARAGDASDLAGVALASAVFSILYWPLGFLRMSIAGLSAKASGSADWINLKTILIQGIALGFGIGALILFAKLPIASLARLVMADDAMSQDALSAMDAYIGVRLFAAPFAIAFFAGVGWLSGQGRTGLMMVVVTLTTALNAALDVAFVLIADMGVVGIALGTALAEGASLVFVGGAIGYVLWREGRLTLGWGETTPTKGLQGFLALNRDIFIRTALLALVFFWFVRASAPFGDTVLAANQVLMQLVLLTGLVLDGPAIAAEAMIGQSLSTTGRAPRKAYGDALRSTATLTALAAIGLSLALWALWPSLIALILPGGSTPAVAETASAMRLWVILAPLYTAPPFWLDGIFIGATRGRTLRNGMIGAAALFALGVLVLTPTFGASGLWAAFCIFMLARAAFLLLDRGIFTGFETGGTKAA